MAAAPSRTSRSLHRITAAPTRRQRSEPDSRVTAPSVLAWEVFGRPGRSGRGVEPAACRGAAAVTLAERIRAVAKQGFTDRQAGFLVTVMLHSGVCVGRQYCAYARIVRGQKMHDFFSSLVAKRLATSVHRRRIEAPGIYHVHGKPLYARDRRSRTTATGSRSRSPAPIERLMVLDAVLAERRSPVARQRAGEGGVLPRRNDAQAERAASSWLRRAAEQTVRYFPDKLPIGVPADGRTHVFLYLVNRPAPVDFRAFLHRHVELLRALAGMGASSAGASPSGGGGARVRGGGPSGARRCRCASTQWTSWAGSSAATERVEAGRRPDDRAGFARARRAFHAPRYRTLYRLWKKDGDALLHATVSPVLEDALARGQRPSDSAGVGPWLSSISPPWLAPHERRDRGNGMGERRRGSTVPPV